MVLRECREAQFWLRLIRTTELSNDARLEPLIRESSELVAIFTTAARKARTPRAADSPNL